MLDLNNLSSDKLQCLFQVLKDINGLIPRDELLEKIVVLGTRAGEANASSLIVIDEEDPQYLIFKVTTGSKAHQIKKIRIRTDQGIAGWVIQTGEPAIVNSPHTDDRFFKKISDNMKFDTYNLLCVPLKYGNKILGALQVINKKERLPFTKTDQRLLEIFANQATIALTITKTFTEKQTTINSLKSRLKNLQKPPILIGKDPAIEKIRQVIQKVAPADVNILITGESGTGKEIIARSLHYYSQRAAEPFVVVNCATIPDNLMESELFGYEQGAFTGADKSKKGKFEMACGGTIFLDEIAELPLLLQTKLLRAIQFGEVEKVGSVKKIRIDARIIAATNVNLTEALVEKRFREDLYYRLNVIPLHLPPLRDRKGDIPLLIDHFLKQFAERNIDTDNFDIQNFLQAYKDYHWPGNVRELENFLERELILATCSLTNPFPHDAPDIRKSDKTPFCLPESMELKKAIHVFKKEYLLNMKEKYPDITKLAKVLEITPSYLRQLCKQYKLPE